jgi:hypothetical protein
MLFEFKERIHWLAFGYFVFSVLLFFITLSLINTENIKTYFKEEVQLTPIPSLTVSTMNISKEEIERKLELVKNKFSSIQFKIEDDGFTASTTIENYQQFNYFISYFLEKNQEVNWNIEEICYGSLCKPSSLKIKLSGHKIIKNIQ